MKIVSIDYGKARIGMARSDALGMLASPIGTVHEKNFRIQLEKVAEIIKNENAEKVVYGLPLNMDGTEGETAELVREFAERFRQRHGGTVICREMLRLNVPMENTAMPENRTAEYYKNRPCLKAVEDAAEILVQIIKENEKGENLK